MLAVSETLSSIFAFDHIMTLQKICLSSHAYRSITFDKTTSDATPLEASKKKGPFKLAGREM